MSFLVTVVALSCLPFGASALSCLVSLFAAVVALSYFRASAFSRLVSWFAAVEAVSIGECARPRTSLAGVLSRSAVSRVVSSFATVEAVSFSWWCTPLVVLRCASVVVL